MAKVKNWTTITESTFPWEREALEFIRQQFPSNEPYRAWANFEFIADDGSINEVDLLVFTPQGCFLIEIKSRPGRLRGDAGTWTWETSGKPLATTDNPLFLANSKAKKLRSLLSRQKAAKKKGGGIPWIDAVVFVSAPDLKCELQGTAANCIRQRDTETRAGIMGTIRRRECPGLREKTHDRYDRPAGKVVAQAMEQAGIRQSQKSRKVSDYLLENLIDEGPGYQDWQASHSTLKNVRRRVRIYNVRTSASEEERDAIRRAAQREAELLETLQHPGILRREGFTEHELGPALIFEHDPTAIRLDHFLAQRGEQLSMPERIDLMRQIADVVRFTHNKRVVHRSLAPQSILVLPQDSDRLQVKIFNWQVGYRQGSSTSGVSRPVTATSHVERLVEDASTAYMAPEAISDEGGVGEHLDIFSLGAIAYHVFSGFPPAASGLELSNKLRESKGLQISSVVNGAGENLQELIQWSTHADVGIRLDTVADFLELLEKVDEESRTQEHEAVLDDPDQATKDDILPGGFRVVRRLGKGATSIGLLVEQDAPNGDVETYILKVAADPEYNDRLSEEAQVLQKLRHTHIVEFVREVEIGDRNGILMRPVLITTHEKKDVQTLARRLQKEGALHVDLLQRFGTDLLGVVHYLEEQGINHRDIKPDNIAIGYIGSSKMLHLVLFDFSLSRAPTDSIHAGTRGYLDPLLPLRKHKRWDLHAERYAAAATLYELATGPGNLPKWGDGISDPSHIDDEATLDAELFDASLRDGLTEFFTRAFRRNPSERFDNTEQMLAAWRDCFLGIEDAGSLSDHENEDELREALKDATFDTAIHDLGLGTRATNALDRANIFSVEDLLSTSSFRLNRLPGVGQKTRREIRAAVRILREKLGKVSDRKTETIESEQPTDENVEVGSLSVDLLVAGVIRTNSREGETAKAALPAILGLDERLPQVWPSQADVADLVEVTRGRIGQLVAKFHTRWSKDAALNRLRSDVAELVQKAGGAMSRSELADAILVARGSAQDEPLRTRYPGALARLCVEVEKTREEPRFVMRRSGDKILIATDSDLATYASKLGEEADRIAAEDPLVPPVRALARLRKVNPPADAPAIADSRLIRLAAAASETAAVSSRQELYPRGMDALRALKLSPGALYGVPTLTPDQIRERIGGRYPEADALPDRPMLDEILTAAGFDFRWDAAGKDGVGCYVSRLRDAISLTSLSESVSRRSTGKESGAEIDPADITPEIADARAFEDRLHRTIDDGAFLALIVGPKNYQAAIRELSHRFDLDVVDVEGIFIDALRDVAGAAGVDWNLVLKTDATVGEGDWNKLMLLVGRAMPIVEARLQSSTKTILMIYPGLLARYEQMPLLQRLRDRVGIAGGIPGLWLLIPGDNAAMIDGKPIPVISITQRARIPESWLRNKHRGNLAASDINSTITQTEAN
ncbi:serine/threonine protein kinase [Rhodopirellula sp. SM50]|nr:BREX system serine/threonine kinase PglW [Rhodopirellula sp. SM50]PAY16332.1 serine/threonine protein kinase [Rhodopirellula sp. SM50]